MTSGSSGAGPLHPRVVHVVVGPEEHGVVRHGREVAQACGDRLVRLTGARAYDLDPAAVDVVHVPFTDRLFGVTAEAAAAAFTTLVDPWLTGGIALSVTLHDLPVGDDALAVRRRDCYDAVVGAARGVVVNSDRELELADRLVEDARSRRRIPLPVPERRTPADRPAPGGDVAVLGFLFPDRGYEHTIDELPPGVPLTALGRASDGHEDLPGALATRAAATGHRLRLTGFVPESELAGRLWAAGVPVAPNRRVAASASINTWIAHGRRPLVPDSPYVRELQRRHPDAVSRYDADRPGELRDRIARALAEPERTWSSPDQHPGPTIAEVAQAYRRHFAGCAPASVITVSDGQRVRQLVPDNRWDLIGPPPEPPPVSVVVPHYDQQHDLDLVLTGLAAQTHPRDRLQVVVVDDGSPRTPSLAAADGLEVTLLRQSRQGFRAAAARNLGATAADGEVLVFLDADTVPTPGYLTALTALPAAAPDVLTVGRRRHADLSGWDPAQLRSWYAGGPGPGVLPEPAWLREAYAESRDLRDADARSYRHVISAVLGLSRDLFTELGGFDESFRHYGGEDWELAHRAWSAGAVFAHVRTAVAWHDGPDWAGRGERAAGAQNAQTLTLAALLPDPVARGGGSWERPAVLLRLTFADPVEVLATARAAFAGDTDVGVWVDHPDAAATVRTLADPRIRAGTPSAQLRASAQVSVSLDAPTRLLGLTELADAAVRTGSYALPTGRVEAHRATGRAGRWATRLQVEPELLAARLFGGRDRAVPSAGRPVDLAHELKQVHAYAHPPTC